MIIHLYSGPCDGARRRIKKTTRYVFVPGATYVQSAEWTAHFAGRATFIPTHFKGRPGVVGGGQPAVSRDKPGIGARIT